MRTTIANRFTDSLTSIQRHARQMADEQVRLSSGVRLLRASDSPLTLGKSIDLRTTEAQLGSLGRLQSAAASRMAESESALRDAGKVLDDLFQLYAMTQNAGIGKDQLIGLSSQAVVLQEELKQILLRTDAAGYRIFNTTALRVIVDGGTAGVDTVKINTVGSLRELNSLNPQAEGYWDGVTDTDGLDAAVDALVYGEDSIVEKFVRQLASGDELGELRPKELPPSEQDPLVVLKDAAQQMVLQQISLGAAQARVDRSVQRTEDLKLSVKTSLSNEIDTDFAQSSTEVQKARVLLEAAQSITAQIGSLNLFQKLG